MRYLALFLVLILLPTNSAFGWWIFQDSNQELIDEQQAKILELEKNNDLLLQQLHCNDIREKFLDFLDDMSYLAVVYDLPMSGDSEEGLNAELISLAGESRLSQIKSEVEFANCQWSEYQKNYLDWRIAVLDDRSMMHYNHNVEFHAETEHSDGLLDLILEHQDLIILLGSLIL